MENTTKFTKTQLIMGVIVLVIILAFVFYKKPTTEQTQNLQETKSGVSQSQDKSSYREQLVNELAGENEQLSKNEISFRFMVHDFFDKLITEGYLNNTDYDKQNKKLTLYLDSDILADRRVETWVTGLAIQVAGGLDNLNQDFAIAADTDPDSGDVIEFAVNNIVVKRNNINGLPAWSGNEALENTKGTDGHAKILDLVISGKIFAHFETGKVFAELNRLGLIGGMTVDGKIIFERKLK